MVRRPAPWLFAVVYGLHLLDEGLVAGGLPDWSMAHGFHFTRVHWLTVSLISFAAYSGAAGLVAARRWPDWVLVVLAVHVALHGLIHLGASVWGRSLSPGVVSGLVLVFPLAGWTFLWARRALDARTLWLAALLGAATLQAPWDLLVRWLFALPVWVR